MANEKRLIDVDQAKRATYEEVFWTESEQAAVRNFLTKIPKVDAVEMVRCKYCKHGIYDEDEQMWECIVGVDFTGDLDTYSMFHEYNDGDHFCSYGEKREGGGE